MLHLSHRAQVQEKIVANCGEFLSEAVGHCDNAKLLNTAGKMLLICGF